MMTRSSIKKALGVLCVLVFVSGCGYSYKSTVLHGIQSISIPTFKNQIEVKDAYTYTSGLDIDVTNEVIDRFVYDGNLKVTTEEMADVILRGTLVQYEQESIRYERHGDVKEYRLFIGVDLDLVDARSGAIMWTEKNFTGRTDYVRSGADARSETAAARSAREDLAKKIVDRVVEDW